MCLPATHREFSGFIYGQLDFTPGNGKKPKVPNTSKPAALARFTASSKRLRRASIEIRALNSVAGSMSVMNYLEIVYSMCI